MYKTGHWGEQAKKRNEGRLEYFRNYHRNKDTPKIGVSLGYLGEIESLNLLIDSKRVRKREYDLLWNGKKIEVKTSSFHFENRKIGGWRFFVRKQRGKCDYFLFICKNKQNETSNVFLVPNDHVTTNEVFISLLNINNFMKYKIEGGDDNGLGKNFN